MARLKNKSKRRIRQNLLPFADDDLEKSNRRSRMKDGYAYPSDKFSAQYDTNWHSRMRIYRLISSLSFYLLTFVSLYGLTKVMDEVILSLGQQNSFPDDVDKMKSKVDFSGEENKNKTKVSTKNKVEDLGKLSFDEFLQRTGGDIQKGSSNLRPTLSNPKSDGSSEKNANKTDVVLSATRSNTSGNHTSSIFTEKDSNLQNGSEMGAESEVAPSNSFKTNSSEKYQLKLDTLKASKFNSLITPNDNKAKFEKDTFKLEKETPFNAFETPQYQKQQQQQTDMLNQFSQLYHNANNPLPSNLAAFNSLPNLQVPRIDIKNTPVSEPPLPQLNTLPVQLPIQPLQSMSNLEQLQHMPSPLEGMADFPQLPILPSLAQQQSLLQAENFSKLRSTSNSVNLLNDKVLSQPQYNAQPNALTSPFAFYQPSLSFDHGQGKH